MTLPQPQKDFKKYITAQGMAQDKKVDYFHGHSWFKETVQAFKWDNYI